MVKAAFYQHPQSFYDVCQSFSENLEYNQVTKFETLGGFTYNGTESLVNFDDSCRDICKLETLLLLLSELFAIWVLYTLNTTCFVKGT